MYKLVITHYTPMSDGEITEAQRRRNNTYMNDPYYQALENMKPDKALDVNLTDEQWEAVKKAVLQSF